VEATDRRWIDEAVAIDLCGNRDVGTHCAGRMRHGTVTGDRESSHVGHAAAAKPRCRSGVVDRGSSAVPEGQRSWTRGVYNEL
jgi:hypothetical protein